MPYSKIYTGSINLSLIDKSKIVKGEKGLYYPIAVFINDEKDQYNQSGSIVTQQSLEERNNGDRRVYIANLKEVETKEEPTPEPVSEKEDDKQRQEEEEIMGEIEEQEINIIKDEKETDKEGSGQEAE